MANTIRDILLRYCIVAATALVCFEAREAIADSLCKEYRMLQNTVEQIADGYVSSDALFQGNSTHAQFDSEGRPVPKLSVIEMKRAWAKVRIPNAEWMEPNVLYYTIYNQKFASKDSEVINLPFDAYWCIAARGDTVLLSDGITHHYTRIASIDRVGQTVDMIDRWPDILRNYVEFSPKTIEAQSGKEAGRMLVRFSRGDFKKLFVAGITLDTADLIERLKLLLPSELWTPELYIALGRTLLYAGRDKTFPAPAAQLFIDGVRAAGRADRQDLVKDTIPVMFTALALTHFIAISEGDEEKAKQALQYISDVKTRFGSEPIKGMDAEDALHIAITATNAQNWEEATFFLEQAIAKDPLNYRAFLQRAIMARDILSLTTEMQNLKVEVLLTKQDEVITFTKKALEDVEKALSLIEKRKQLLDQRIVDRKHKNGVYWELGRVAEQVDGAERDAFDKHKADALNLSRYLRYELDKRETDILQTKQK